MQAIYQPLSINDLYFGSAFATNTFLGSKESGTNPSLPQNTGSDYTASLISINTPPVAANNNDVLINNILLIGGFAVLIGLSIYYYSEYKKTTLEQNKYKYT